MTISPFNPTSDRHYLILALSRGSAVVQLVNADVAETKVGGGVYDDDTGVSNSALVTRGVGVGDVSHEPE